MADDASPSSANAPEPQAAGEESKETTKPKERGSTGLLPFKVLLTQDQVNAKSARPYFADFAFNISFKIHLTIFRGFWILIQSMNLIQSLNWKFFVAATRRFSNEILRMTSLCTRSASDD